ncbi:hypothetical protein [Amycolatopsis minnesotensis]|uniref:Secreted protein n=1 Tax=Amycolatopsis minnesotensis TaxID=337894 RepID=A0ABN2Q8C6_9PSEU
MNIVRTAFVALSVAGIAAAGSGVASADGGTYLHLDRTTVTTGDTVRVVARCSDGEGLNFVGSEAFSPTGDDGPYQGNGGVVPFHDEADGGLKGSTVVRADVAPGVYHVGQRCGGGNAGGVDLTVTP